MQLVPKQYWYVEVLQRGFECLCSVSFGHPESAFPPVGFHRNVSVIGGHTGIVML